MAINAQEMEDNAHPASDLTDSVSERVKSALDTLLSTSAPPEPEQKPVVPQVKHEKEPKAKKPKAQGGGRGRKRKTPSPPPTEGGEDWVIRCDCNVNEDIGFMLQCNTCGVWQHGDCVDVRQDTLPENFYCSLCKEELHSQVSPSSEEFTTIEQNIYDPSAVSAAKEPETQEEKKADNAMPSTAPAAVEGRKLDSKNWTQWGLFAPQGVSSGDFVGEFVGDVQLKDSAAAQDPSFLRHVLLVDLCGLQINARKNGNSLRFVRRSCKPNAETRIVYTDGFLRVIVLAKQQVAPNGEITVPFEFDALSCQHIIDCGCEDKDSCEIVKHNRQLVDAVIAKRGPVNPPASTAASRRGTDSESVGDEDELAQRKASEQVQQPVKKKPGKKPGRQASRSALLSPTSTISVDSQTPRLSREERKLQEALKQFERLESQQPRGKRRADDELSAEESPRKQRVEGVAKRRKSTGRAAKAAKPRITAEEDAFSSSAATDSDDNGTSSEGDEVVRKPRRVVRRRSSQDEKVRAAAKEAGGFSQDVPRSPAVSTVGTPVAPMTPTTSSPMLPAKGKKAWLKGWTAESTPTAPIPPVTDTSARLPMKKKMLGEFRSDADTSTSTSLQAQSSAASLLSQSSQQHTPATPIAALSVSNATSASAVVSPPKSETSLPEPASPKLSAPPLTVASTPPVPVEPVQPPRELTPPPPPPPPPQEKEKLTMAEYRKRAALRQQQERDERLELAAKQEAEARAREQAQQARAEAEALARAQIQVTPSPAAAAPLVSTPVAAVPPPVSVPTPSSAELPPELLSYAQQFQEQRQQQHPVQSPASAPRMRDPRDGPFKPRPRPTPESPLQPVSMPPPDSAAPIPPPVPVPPVTQFANPSPPLAVSPRSRSLSGSPQRRAGSGGPGEKSQWDVKPTTQHPSMPAYPPRGGYRGPPQRPDYRRDFRDDFRRDSGPGRREWTGNGRSYGAPSSGGGVPGDEMDIDDSSNSSAPPPPPPQPWQGPPSSGYPPYMSQQPYHQGAPQFPPYSGYQPPFSGRSYPKPWEGGRGRGRDGEYDYRGPRDDYPRGPPPPPPPRYGSYRSPPRDFRRR